MSCWNDSNDFVRALRSPKIEFVLAQHPWFENDCHLADLVLPSITKMECDDIDVETMSGQFYLAYPESKAIEPRGEAKSNYQIVSEIATRFGLREEYTEGKSPEEWIKTGYEKSGIAQEISWEAFKKKGYYIVPNDENWQNQKTGLAGFYNNPAEYPLDTPSGKIEFYSERLAKNFPNDIERPPSPRWIPYGETHQESLLSDKAKTYPLLVVSNHPRWRVHSQHDDMTWTREIHTCKVRGQDGYLYEPVWLNPADAKIRKIKDGDIVKIFNDRGALLAGAWVTERIRPGVVYIDHGARWDPIIPGELDRGGAINTISPHHTTSKNASGMVCSGFLVNIEKANLDILNKQYPAAFNRPYNHDAGLVLERVLHGDSNDG
jgi:trimethylamine-N-oxide reductase (cytochrome c)